MPTPPAIRPAVLVVLAAAAVLTVIVALAVGSDGPDEGACYDAVREQMATGRTTTAVPEPCRGLSSERLQHIGERVVIDEFGSVFEVTT